MTNENANAGSIEATEIYVPHRKSLREMFQECTVAQIRRYLKELSLKMKSGVKKDILAKGVSQWILSNPKQVVTSLFTYELRMYDELINHPENLQLIPRHLARLPFDSLTVYDDELVSYVAPDLAEKFSPILADTISEREKSGEEAIENHILGLLNLRGSMKLDDYIEIIEPLVKNNNLDDIILYRFNRLAAGNDYDDEIILESPFVADSDFNPFDERCVDPDVEPKDFSQKEIAEASRMPYPRIGGDSRMALKRQLLKLGKSEREAEDSLYERWIGKQLESSDTLREINSVLSGLSLSEKQLTDTIPLITGYLNNMPFWKFKGWSSSEIAARAPRLIPGQMPHITMGPNLRARGITSFEQLQGMAARDESIPDMPLTSTKKVGRNDPCPCGSGKKYKHCCGR